MHERADANMILKLFSTDPSTKTTSDFNVMNLSRGKQRQSEITRNIQTKNNKRIQRAPIITSIKTRMNRMNQ
jgi:hypothetical protein